MQKDSTKKQPKQPESESTKSGGSNASWEKDPESLVKEPAKKPPDASTPLVKKIRIVYPDMQPIEVSTSSTVAALLLGEHSSAEHMLFEACIKQNVNWFGITGPHILWGLWYIGALIGILVVAKIMPMKCVWASVLMLPLPLTTLLLMSTDLLKCTLYGLDLYIIYILQFALFVDGVYFCKSDQRVVFWVCYLPTLLASGVIDAYPAKYRASFAKQYFGAMLAILIGWNYLMVFKFNAFGSLNKLSNISFILHHVSDQATLGVFYCRHIYVSMFNENCFVMIKSDCITGSHECEIAKEILPSGKEEQKMLFHPKGTMEVLTKHEVQRARTC